MALENYRSPRQVLLGQDNNALVLLFAANTLMFVGIHFIKIIYFLSDIPEAFFFRQILDWLTLSPQPDVFLYRPWTLFTHFITHYSIWQLISTVLWLWAFGFILQDLAGNKKIIPLYLYGGLIGSLVFLAANHFVPALERNLGQVSPLMGGGAAVMCMAVATTTLAPDYRIFPLLNGGIPLWVLTLLFAIFDFTALSSANAGIGAGHLAAGAFGFFFAKQLQKGRDWSSWMISLVENIDGWFNPEKKSPTPKDKLFYRANRKPYEKITQVTQQKLDAILDKINQHGYSFLTDEEKAFLQKASEE